MRKSSRIMILLAVCSLFIALPTLRASWVENGIPICTETDSQRDQKIVSDGTGGGIVTWYDRRSGSHYDIYAQRIEVTGRILWTMDGVPICTEADNQHNPQLIFDESGWAIITWEDNRSSSADDIYAQRVDTSGTVQWLTNGVSICTSTGSQQEPQIATDGAGGAIVTWKDFRNGVDINIYAQRIDPSGTTLWTSNGVVVSAASGPKHTPQLIEDGAGGAIITWYDNRAGNADIYAQRINSSGASLWTTDGVPVCTVTDDQYYNQMISDGAGGAIILWLDYRSGSYWDIYAQRINSSGVRQWATNGVPICTVVSTQKSHLRIISDGASGAIATWYDSRYGDSDIFAQRIDDSGTVQWTADGVSVCAEPQTQNNPYIISDGSGGAYITWADRRNFADYDIRGQLLDSSGGSQWVAGGVLVCASDDDQNNPVMTSGGINGVIVAWQDERNGDFDIYAQHLNSRGRTGLSSPAIQFVRDVPGDEGGKVTVAWNAMENDYFAGTITEYTVWRALATEAALSMIESGAVVLTDPEAGHEMLERSSVNPDAGRPGREDRLLIQAPLGSEIYYWELMGTQAAYRLLGYSMTVETLFDSTAVCSDYHYFQVIAHSSKPGIYWTSDPDSGYSVDNIAPCPPLCLAGEQSYVPEGLFLYWAPNREADLDCYHVYRDITPGFIPGPGNLLDSVCDTTTFDGDWSWDDGFCYMVSAVDIHGNESGYASLCSDAVTGGDPAEIPAASFLSQNYPNPFNPVTTIAFGLKERGHVSLRIYDAAGRLVTTLVDETRNAGQHTAEWNGRGTDGRAVSSGVYFYLLRAVKFEETKKMILLR